MGWLRFLSFIFNLLGILFLLAAVGSFLLGATIGGASGSGSSDAAALSAFMGGMMGTLAAFGNFVASLLMFFFGAVLWALRRLVELAELYRPVVEQA